MKTKRTLLHSAWLFILISHSACTDHLTLPTTPGLATSRLRVRTLTQDSPGNRQYVNLFRYDGQNRLSSILTYQTPDSAYAPVENSTYQYDAQNRLMQIRREIQVRSTGYGNWVEMYNFGCNAAGQLADVNYEANYGAGGYNLTLRYTGSQLTGSSENSANPAANISYQETNQFTFTGNNLTTINTTARTVLRGPVLERNFTSTQTHDDKRNPFYGLYLLPRPGSFFSPSFGDFGHSTYYGGFGNVLNLSQNNVLTTGMTTSYQYTYNAADLPATRQTTVDGAVTETLQFEYETY